MRDCCYCYYLVDSIVSEYFDVESRRRKNSERRVFFNQSMSLTALKRIKRTEEKERKRERKISIKLSEKKGEKQKY